MRRLLLMPRAPLLGCALACGGVDVAPPQLETAAHVVYLNFADGSEGVSLGERDDARSNVSELCSTPAFAAWPGAIPLVVVPTAYPELTEAKARALGKIAIMIYANHAVRAAVTAMREVFAAIRRDGGIHQVDKRIASVEEIFELQHVPAMKAAERKYLR